MENIGKKKNRRRKVHAVFEKLVYLCRAFRLSTNYTVHFSAESPPQKRKRTKPNIHGVCAFGADFSIVCLELVVSLAENMVMVCVIFMSFK